MKYKPLAIFVVVIAIGWGIYWNIPATPKPVVTSGNPIEDGVIKKTTYLQTATEDVLISEGTYEWSADRRYVHFIQLNSEMKFEVHIYYERYNETEYRPQYRTFKGPGYDYKFDFTYGLKGREIAQSTSRVVDGKPVVSQMNIEYDSQGRVSKESWDNGGDTIVYKYEEAGGKQKKSWSMADDSSFVKITTENERGQLVKDETTQKSAADTIIETMVQELSYDDSGRDLYHVTQITRPDLNNLQRIPGLKTDVPYSLERIVNFYYDEKGHLIKERTAVTVVPLESPEGQIQTRIVVVEYAYPEEK